MKNYRENNAPLDLSAIAVDSIVDMERIFGRNSEEFLEKTQRRNRRNRQEPARV
jgi:hypothetical protein